MYCLIRLSRDLWCVGFEPDGICERVDFDQAVAMLRSFRISFDEIEQGVVEMVRLAHDVCEWGVNGKFTYTRPAREEIAWAV